MSSTQTSVNPCKLPARSGPRLPAGLAFTGNAVTFISLYLAAGAPTPLLAFYQQRWEFPAAALTLAFAVYAIGFLAALLTVGSLSDHVGRRPVLIGSLVVQLVSTLMFLVAPDIGWVIAARVVQGLATGAATSAFTAALAELAPPNRKKLGSILGSVGMTAGLAVGALLSGFAIQFITEANTIIFAVLAIVTVMGILVVAFSPESVSRTPGAIRSLIPRVSVPRAARKEFVAAAPVMAAIWMLAGLSLGLAPTIVRHVFHLNSGLVNGLSGFIAPATAAVVAVAFGRLSPRSGMTLGIYASIAGTVGVVTAVLAVSLALMITCLVITGIGFGAAFSGSLRLILPLAGPQQRSGIVAAIYVLAYIAFGLPVIIAGQLSGPVGLVPTIAGYGCATVVLALLGLVAQFRRQPRRPSVNGKDTRRAVGSGGEEPVAVPLRFEATIHSRPQARD